MGDNQSLRAINEELIKFMERAEQAMEHDDEQGDGTVSFNFTEEMERLMDKLSGKVDSVVNYMFKLSGDVAGIDAKVEAMQKAKTRKLNKINKLENMLRYVLKQQGIEQMDIGEHTVKLQKNPPKVDVTAEYEIPKEYFKYTMQTTKALMYEEYVAAQEQAMEEGVDYKFTDKLDKTAVKNDLKQGKDIPGTVLVQETRLKID